MAEFENQAPETFDLLGSTRRAERRRDLQRGAEVLLGLSLVVVGWRRVSLLGFVLGAAGGALMIRGLTGKRLRVLARQLPERVRSAVRGERRDRVDEALLGTFPASDPPAY